MRPFADPESSFSGLSAKAVADLIAGGADLALVVDEKGVICDVACGSDDLANERWSRWLGQPLIQTVTVESRPKIEALLRDVRSSEGPRWRQVNHPSHDGPDLPLTYFAIPIEDDKRMPPLKRSVFFGRDLRALSALQQSLVNAQQEALQDHWKLREAQSRNRHLFQTASDGVLIVDAVTQKIIEANPAAMALYVDRTDRLTGSTFPIGLDENDMHAVQNMLASVRTNGRSDSVRAQLNGAELNVSASLFRQESGSQLVVRMTTTLPSVTPSAIAGGQSVLLKLVKSAPDCMVVTDPEGLIVSANDAFLELVHLTAESQVRGESLGRWLGRTGVELNVLIGTLRQRGSIRLFPTHLRDDHGAVTDIEVSATQAQEGGDTFLGFTIRDISRRPTTQARGDKELPRSASQLAELVGRVPMKDIVGETTDLIEQLCIEAALDLTRDNRAAAAEMLGLSRQSLYVKLRRYGLSEPVAEGEK